MLGRYAIGFYVLPRFNFPVEFAFNLQQIQGGSAGIILSLYAAEMLTEKKVIPDINIGGTGAINSSGEIMPIASLKQKIIAGHRNGNEVFIFPASMCSSELPTYQDMVLLPVTSLEDAITQLNNFAEGKTIAKCKQYQNQ